MDAPTLNRFFSLHYLLPFVIAAVVALHIWALHVPGNNNPTGVNVKSKSDTVPFHPYYTVKDGFAVSLFMILFAVFVFYLPEAFDKADNHIPANPLVTPAHIVPEWYLLPFYAILRAIPDKLTGVLALGGAIACSSPCPGSTRSKVRSMRYRPTARLYFFIWIVACLALGWCGSQEPRRPGDPGRRRPDLHRLRHQQRDLAQPHRARSTTSPISWSSRRSWGCCETPLPVPDSLYTPVLAHPAAAPAGAAAAPEKKG